MNSRITKAAVGTTVAALALIAGAGLVPSVAAAATAEGSVSTRIERITEALSSLVTDGTLTQEQADEVAETLDGAMPRGRHGGPGHGGPGHGGPGHGGPGHGGPALDTAAEALGLTVEQLREQLRSGLTLGEVADAQGVGRDTLLDALVAEAQEHLAQAVEDGRLTQKQADERSVDLRSRIEQRLSRSAPHAGARGSG